MVIHAQTLQALERAGGNVETTNNRMEIQAAVEVLRTLRRPSKVLLLSDSEHLIDVATKWMAGWKASGWKKRGGPLKNVDLLQDLDVQLCRHGVEWRWVRGHSGDPGNTRVDELANLVMDRLSTSENPTYEKRFKWSHSLPPGARA